MANDLEEQGSGGGRTKTCPVCRAENESDATQCSSCLYTFTGYEEQPLEATTENGEMFECPECGAELTPGSTSCVVCGTTIAAEPEIAPVVEDVADEGNTICPGCGAELPADTASCFICGESIAEESTEATPVEGVLPEEEVPAELPEGLDEEVEEEVPVDDTDWDLGVVGGEELAEGELDEPVQAEAEGIADEEPDELPSEEETEPDIEEEPQEEKVEFGPNEFPCPSCNLAVSIGSSRCPNCWVELPEMVRCPHCSLVIPLESEACPDCFAKLEGGVLIEAPMSPESETEEVTEEPDEDLMPQEETEEYEEEITELYGVECPFCNAIINAGEDICPECGMPLIEGEEGVEGEEEEEIFRQPERDWYRTTAFILVLILLFSALAPFLISLPHVDRDRIRIDGDFGDWETIANHTDVLEGINPNIDIIDYKLVSDAFNIYFYLQVEGRAFGDSVGDTARIFIDIDQDETTGYRVLGTGADYMLRIFGHGGEVESSSCMIFNSTRAQNDFNGFDSFCPSVPHTADDVEDNDKFEVRIDLEFIGLEPGMPITAVYYMGNSYGEYDYSDKPISNLGSVLVVTQSSAVPLTGILTGASDVLDVDIDVAGSEVNITSLTVPGYSISGTYATVNENQSAQVTIRRDVSGVAAGTLVSLEIDDTVFSVVEENVDIVVLGMGAFAYANGAPATIQIDGAFGDWTGKGSITADAADDQMNKNDIDAISDTGLDMLEQRTAFENNALNIFVESAGDMMAGMWVPEVEERFVFTTPDTRSDDNPVQNDLIYNEPEVTKTTRQQSATIERPQVKPVKTGEGCVKVFLDTDNDTATGYLISDIGADMLAEVFGQDGEVTRTRFSTFSAIDQNMQEWTIDTTITPSGASAGSRIEISVPTTAFGGATTSNVSAVIQLVDWNLNGDMSDLTSWDVFESGTRRGTRGPGLPSAWVKGAVTLDGQIRAEGTTVVAVDPVSNKRVTSISYYDVGPFATNYAVYIQGAGGSYIDIHATNGSHQGMITTYHPTTNPAIAEPIELANPIPDTAPSNFMLENLGLIGLDAIKLTWDVTTSPDEFRIWRTTNTVNENGYTGVGRYYGATPLTTLAGNSHIYVDGLAVENITNYYFIESLVGTDYNYSVEVGIVPDYYPPTIAHDPLDESYSNIVYVEANITDGAFVDSAQVHFKKVVDPTWSTASMQPVEGEVDNVTRSGTWSGFITVPTFGQYEYYISGSDGQNPPTTFGSEADPIPLNISQMNDPYPIYGYTYLYDGTSAGGYSPILLTSADVWITWWNMSSGMWSTIYTISDAVTGQYSVDLLNYSVGGIVYCNATDTGPYGNSGHNVTTIEVVAYPGGRWQDIICGVPYDIEIIIPPDLSTVSSGVPFATQYEILDVDGMRAWGYFTTGPVFDGPTYWHSNDSLFVNPFDHPYTWDGLAEFTPAFWSGFLVLYTLGSVYINITETLYDYELTIWHNLYPAFKDWDNITLDVVGANISMTKWAPPTANSGQEITYWVNYSNEGSSWAYDVWIYETYPPEVTFVSSIPIPSIGNNIWNQMTVPQLAALAPGASGSLEITVAIDPNATAGTILNNTVLINGTGIGSTWAWAETLIIDPQMNITKNAPATANTNETIMYSITYWNIGSDTAYNVWIVETYPPGVTFVNSTPIPTVNPNMWFIGDLPPGAGGIIYINVTVNANASGVLNNTVYTICEDANGEIQDRVYAYAITLIIDPLMTITKTAPATANTNETIMYILHYENIGTDTAYNVWINDTLPVGVGFVDSNPVVTIPGPPTWCWSVGNVPPGGSGDIFINVTILPGTNGTITNWVSLEYRDFAGQLRGPIYAFADTLIINPLMEITKWGPPTANSGDIITYWINYSNVGTAPAYNVVITETYPVGVTFISAIPVPDPPTDNQWTFPVVPPGTSGSIEILVLINNGTSGWLFNNVTMEYNNSVNTTQLPVNVSAATFINDPLMVITKTAPATANPGDIITYTITYQNIGNDIAYDVVITETYPAGVTFIIANPVPDVPTNNVWSVGDIPPGGSGFIDITVQIDVGTTGELNNTVVVDYQNSAGEQQIPVYAYAVTMITWPMMEVYKDGPANATAGDTIMYTITYFNSGTDTAHNVTITETYPAGVTFVNATPPPDPPTDNFWTIGDVPAGTGGNIYINVTIDANATGLLINNITLEYENMANQTQNPIHAVWITFLSGPFMEITKTAPATANTGETIMYVITYTNVGDDTAYNVVITETYPPGVTFVDANPLPDVPTNNVWTIGSVAPNETGYIFINVTINESANGPLMNWVFLNYENSAGIPQPEESAWAITVIIDPLMVITKIGPATANTGETIMYTIMYQNVGTDTAYNVVITETYPPGVVYVDANPLPDVPTNNVWTIGTVLPGEVGYIYINVTITATVGPIINNVVLNYTDAVGEYQMEVSDFWITEIINPFIVITKTGPANASPGEIITYTIWYTNIGNDWAYNVTITETYPPGVNFISAIPVPDPPTNNVWTIGAVAPFGGSGSIVITVQIDPTVIPGSILINWANVTYNNSVGIAQAEESAFVITLIIDCEISIEKVAPATANTGEVFTYFIYYNNTGNAWAYNVVITETYPAGVTFMFAIPAPDIPTDNVWSVGDVGPGTGSFIEITVFVNLNVPWGTWLNNTVVVDYQNAGGTPYQNTTTAATLVIDPELIISKTGPATAVPNEIITYTITYQNIGNDIAYNVIITETYPPEVTFLSAIPAPDVPTDNVWSVGDLNPGAGGTIDITVQISPTANGTIINLVVADYWSAIRQMPQVSAINITDILGPFIVITKVGPFTANQGDIFDYVISYQNIGNDWAYNVVITETYPVDVTYIIADPLPSIGNNIWTSLTIPQLAALAPGAGGFITITVQVNTPPPPLTFLLNNVTVDYENSIGTPYQNWAEWFTNIDGPVLTMTKTAPATANTGQNIDYVITIENIGNGAAMNVIFTEIYPAGVTYVTASIPPTVPNFIWNIGIIAAGGTWTVTITVNIDINAAGVLMNSAYVDYTNLIGTPWPTVWAFANTTIIDPEITITKSAPATANTNETITYTLTVENVGTDTAYNVVVTETYPVGVTFQSAIPWPSVGDNVWDGSTIPQFVALPAGSIFVITITVLVDAQNGTMMNMANVSYENSARTMPVVWAYANTTIINPNIVLTKDAPATANPGEIITYYINYSNTGTGWAYDLVITETYPFGVTYIIAIPLPDVPTDNVWTIPAVPPGGNGSIEITVQIAEWATGWLNNSVTANYSNQAGAKIPVNVSAATLIQAPLMVITKTAPPIATQGEIITYTITYQNIGNDTAYNVVITENYPAGVIFLFSVPPPSVGNFRWDQTTIPALAALPPGAGGTIDITVLIEDTATGVLTNWVYLDYYSNATAMPQESAWAQTIIVFPVLIITKDAPATANTGETIMYTITVQNIGDANAENVVVTETYPVGVTYVDANPAPDVPTDNVWTIGTLIPGQIYIIYINVTITATSGILINTAVVNYENYAGLPYDEQATAQTLIINPIMEITKWAPPTANTGEVITYFINYTNIGTDWAYNVVITETYPLGVTFVSAFPAPDVPTDNVWTIGAIPPGGSGSIEISVLVNTLGLHVNFVVLEYDNAAGISQVPVNATAMTLVGDPIMEMWKVANATAVPGETIMYEIWYMNNGTADAYNVVITETYPPGVTFVDANPLPDPPTDNVWTIGTVPAGTGGVIFINVTIDLNTTGYITNFAEMIFEDAAGNIRETITAEAITVISGPYVIIEKVGPPYANPGETIMYWIHYENIGNETAYNVIITETYPPDVIFVDANPVPDVPTNNVWTIGDLPPGASGNIYINVTVDANATGNQVNFVVVDYHNVANVSMQNNATAITIIWEPVMIITKDAPAQANPGQTITYWINYINVGPDWAYNVTITETYPAFVTFISAIPAPDVPTDNVWTIGAVAPGGSGSIEIIVLIDINATGQLDNFVLLEYNNSAGNAMEPVNATAITLIVDPVITVMKTAPATAYPGELITYTITYWNNGTIWAYNVWIYETYPAGVTFITAIPLPDLGNYGWMVGNVAPGGSGSIEITVQVDMNATGILVNNVTLEYENSVGTDMEPVNASATTLIIFPYLTITKDAPATANTGETIVYTITVTNEGTAPAANVWVTEIYPAGVTFVSAAPVPTVDNNQWLYPGLLMPGWSWVIQITVTINNSAQGTLWNTAVVEYQDIIGQDYPYEYAMAATVIIDPVMEITKEAPATANPGQIITYWINYSNVGTDWAYNVVITDTYPAGVAFVAANPAPDVPTNNVWTIGAVPPGGTGTIEITVMIEVWATGTLRNWAFLEYESAVRDMPIISDYADTTIINPVMVITKDAPATANTGQVITYTITYENIGTDWAYNVVITDTYPAGVTFISANPAPDIPTNNVWSVGDVAPGGGGTIMITVRIDDNAVGILTNWVYLDYENAVGPQQQVSASASTMVIDPYLVITKDAPATANPGEIFIYTITIENVGNDAAYNVWIYETYPAGILYITASPQPFFFNNIWVFPIIPAGSTVTIEITVQVDPSASGMLMNQVRGNYTDINGEYQDQVYAIAYTLIINPRMTITKWAPPYANATDNITYWLNWSNTGTDWAYNVVITETYPVGVTFISATPSPNAGDNVWFLGSVAPGASGAIEITVQIGIGVSGILENLATMTYDNGAGIQYMVWATAITVVGDTPLMSIIKTGPATANGGEVFMYSITYMNIGNATAYNVWINDTLPNGVVFFDSNPVPTISIPPLYCWGVGDLLPGAGGTIFINVTVDGTKYGNITNIAQVEYKNTTGMNYINYAMWTTLIIDPLMVITKTGNNTASVGETIMYTIRYENVGNDTAYNVVITETYPVGYVFVDANPVPDIPTDNVWSQLAIPQLAALAPGAYGYIFINITLTVPGILYNNVTLTYDDANGTVKIPVNATVITIVDLPAGYVIIDKWASPTANPGGYIMYIINYTNVGQFPANNVIITETYPAGITFVNATPAPVVPTDNLWDQTVIPQLAALPPGAGGSIFINISVNLTTNGTLMNQVTATWDAVNQTHAFANTTLINPLMYIVKTAPVVAESPSTIQYTIQYFNIGTDTAYNVNITEVYPPGVTYFSAVPLPTFGDNVWIIAAVPAGGSGTITITVTIAPGLPTGTELNNTVFMNYTNEANVNQTMEMDWAVTVITDVVMTLTKMAPASANPGDTIIYTITYFNEGPSDATNVGIEEFYPPGVTFVSSLPNPPDVPTDNCWTIGNVPAGTGGTITITVLIDIAASGVLWNRAMMNYTDTGSEVHFLNATAFTVVTGPFIVLTKTAPVLISPGDVMIYTITYENIGPGIAANVVITENYPAGVIFNSAIPAPSSGNNIWNLPNLNPGDIGTIVIAVIVDTYAFDTLTNWVYCDYQNLSGGQQPTVWANAMTLVAGPSIVITKTGPAYANPGQTITYDITVTNLGLGIAENVVVRDPIPAGLTFNSATMGGIDMGTYVRWMLGSIASGGSVTLTVTFDIGMAPPAVITNWAFVNYTDSSGTAYPTMDDYWITLIVNPLMNITKTGPATANSGEVITYWINYINNGNDWAYNVVITETYSADVVYVSAIPAPSIGNNVWDQSTVPQLAAIAPGGSGSIQVTVQILPGVANGTDVINIATLDYNNNAGAMPVETAIWITTVLDPFLTVVKIAPATANTGEIITYTIWVNNTGGAAAYNIVVVETYPAEMTYLTASILPDFPTDNTWTILFLPAQGSWSVTITLVVNNNTISNTTATNTVTVDYEDSVGEVQGTIIVTANTLIIDPLLTIVKTGPASSNTGQTIMYMITVTNVGDDVAYNINVTEQYSPWVTFVDANPVPTFGDDVWIIASLDPGNVMYIFINVTIDDQYPIINRADAYYDDAAGEAQDPIFDTHTTLITNPFVVITKTANATAVAGGYILYNITYENYGTGNATNLILTDLYPAGVTYVAALPIPDGGTDNVWTIANLGPGEVGWINIWVMVDTTVNVGTVLNNSANLTYNDIFGTPRPEVMDSANTLIIAPQILINKTGPTNATLMDIFNYTITYENIGNDWAYNVVVIDALPAGVTFISATPAPTTIFAGTLSWDLGTLAAGASGTIEIWVQVNGAAGSRIINNASVSYENSAGLELPDVYSLWITYTEVENNPPEIYTTPPLYAFVGDNITIFADVIDRETGVDTVIIYYIDIFGNQFSAVMTPLNVNLTTMNGMYVFDIPAQTYKGIVTYFIWANDTVGLSNRTGLFDVPIRLPPYFVWGRIMSARGLSVAGAIVLVTDTDTNETVIAVADGTGNYEVDLATLYSGYMDGEALEVFATDGSYYGYNYSTIDLGTFDDTSMSRPNRNVDVVLNEIPEFTTMLLPILSMLLLVFVLRRRNKVKEDERR